MGWAGLMSATELEEVQALIERVLPDPSGYAQRLLLQVMTQLHGLSLLQAPSIAIPALLFVRRGPGCHGERDGHHT